MADNIEEIRARKKALRKAQRGKTVYSDERRKEESRKVAQRLEKCIENNEGQGPSHLSNLKSQISNLLVFFPLPDEPDLRPLYARWQSVGMQLYLPRMIGDDLEVCRYDSDDDLREGPFHVLEPAGEAISKEEMESIDVILVPGMLFDKEGRRLGRGKGYYDRLLSAMKGKAHTIGVCYKSQIVEALPVEPHDMRVDKILKFEEDV